MITSHENKQKGMVKSVKGNGKDNKSEEGLHSAEANDFEFLQEKIKERPINKKKLFKSMMITASAAILFGGLACLSFLLLEPVLNNWMYPEEEPMVITFPQEEDEMLPEDMLTEGTIADPVKNETQVDNRFENYVGNTAGQSETLIEETGAPLTNLDGIIENADEEQDNNEAFPDLIKTQYDELFSIYKDVSSSMVTVTAVRSEMDWFNNTFQSEGSAAGVIIANNNKELLILTNKLLLEDAEQIIVSFCNGVETNAEIKQTDKITEFAVVAVDLKYISETTLENITVASLGSSTSSGITGSPVIAIGNLYGYKDNVCYGIVTSMGNSVVLVDNEYKLITTDIYASQKPTGILVNLSGEVIGIICNSYNNEDTMNLVSALGITELKGMIAKLSNGEASAYLGMQVQDISPQAKKELNIPQGAYIANIDMDSPAMLNGIQKGDIVIKMDDQIINNAKDYMNALREASLEQPLDIAILRAGVETYERMEFKVTPTLHPSVEVED